VDVAVVAVVAGVAVVWVVAVVAVVSVAVVDVVVPDGVVVGFLRGEACACAGTMTDFTRGFVQFVGSVSVVAAPPMTRTFRICLRSCPRPPSMRLLLRICPKQ